MQLFGAGREKRIYAVPPYTDVKSLDFEDHPFSVQQWDEPCDICGSRDSYLDEVVTDDKGGRVYICSDTDYCRKHLADGIAASTVPPTGSTLNILHEKSFEDQPHGCCVSRQTSQEGADNE